MDVLPLDQATLETFAPHVGESFSGVLAGVQIELTLVEATELAGGHPDRTREPFSLLFQTGALGHVRQGLLQLSHPILGNQEIFVVAVKGDEKWMYFEAIFN